jgi:pyruvate dehydrogenase E1 component alpha subunit
VACFFGDGAACEGIFHESVNLASVWNLPVLYICENNQWQAYVHRRETMRIDQISKWASSYGIEGITVDGNDVEAVHAAAGEAVGKIRERRKPILLEVFTYRMRGHFEPDDQAYVDPKELSEWAAKDPIERFSGKLLKRGLLSSAQIANIEQDVQRMVEDAAAFANSSSFPELSELTTDVYA